MGDEENVGSVHTERGMLFSHKKTTRMTSKGVLPSEVSQTKKDKHCVTYFHAKSKKTELRYREQTGGCQRQGMGGCKKWPQVVKRHRCPVMR